MKINKMFILKRGLLACLPLHAIANDKPLAIVDVYGTTLITPEAIKKSYLTEITNIALGLGKQDISQPGPALDRYIASTKMLSEGIKSNRNFAYVGISPITYPLDPTIYIT